MRPALALGLAALVGAGLGWLVRPDADASCRRVLREAVTDTEVETLDDLAQRAGLRLDWATLRNLGQ